MLTIVLTCAGAPAWPATSTAGAAYAAARNSYFDIEGNAAKQRFRHNWLAVIAAFRKVYDNFATSPEAPRAMYTAAELWRELYEISRVPADLDQALVAYGRVPRAYNEAGITDEILSDDALFRRARIYLRRGDRPSAAREVRELLRRYPKGDMVGAAKKVAAELADVTIPAAPQAAGSHRRTAGRRGHGTVRVTRVEHWSNTEYTRVAIYLSGESQARAGRVPGGGGEPTRLYVDIAGAQLDKGAAVAPRVEIGDGLVTSLRVAQFDKKTVRVVIEMTRPANHRVMVLDNPPRVVLDAFPGHAGAPRPMAGSAGGGGAGEPDRIHVVIDPGHGGADGGADGPKKLQEKTVVLAIAKEVAVGLRSEGLETTLTRTGDTTVSLEERTAIANRSHADVFVSIHANSFADHSARGVETYYLDVTDDHYALRLAAVENQTSESQVSELQLILTDLSTKAFTAESMLLAKRIQKRLFAAAKAYNSGTRDLGVKGSLFYVLLGARMPAVLVEVSFLSNPKEGKLLASADYQKALARAITAAIVQHVKAPSVIAEP